jgi:predicted nucleotidyltransferase
MNLQQIKSKIQEPEYDFLRIHPDLNDNIILLTLGGSHAYGTNIETSDIDIRGICLNSKEEILTMRCKDKPIVETNTDTTVYYLKQIIELLISNNPNCLEIMGCKNEHYLILKPFGKLLRDNINLFLSQRVAYTFGSYATSQLRRLQNALARDNYPQSEKEQHILKSIEGQKYHIQTNYTTFEDKNMKLYIDKSHKADFDTEIYIDVNLKHYPLRDFKGMYSDMANVIKDYDSLNHRNNKKDQLHLDKHAMHLVRLLITGAEILEGKGITTHRQQDRDFLMSIRNGDLVKDMNGVKDYSEIFAIVNNLEHKFKYAKENTVLPEKPDYDAINELVMKINKAVVR